MPRRSFSPVALAAALALLAFGATAATAGEAQAASRCDQVGKTVVRTSTVRIYRNGSKAGYGKKMAPHYFACLRHRDTKAWRLPVLQLDGGGWIGFHSFRIAGHFVGYVQEDHPGEELNEYVESVNVASGKARWYAGSNPFHAVASLTLSRSGFVAYIDQAVPYGNDPAQSPRFHVYRGVAGKRSLLDSGDDIAPASLAIVGFEVHWVRGGQARSAPFRN